MTMNDPGRQGDFNRYENKSYWGWILGAVAVLLVIGAIFWRPAAVSTASNNNPAANSSSTLNTPAAGTVTSAAPLSPAAPPASRPNG